MNPSPAASLVPAGPLDDPQAARLAGRDDLSLMLIDARSRSLRWLAAFEAAGHLRGGAGPAASPLRWIGHAAWFQEYWIARHVQRGRGELAEHGVPRLPGLEARTDAWFAPAGLQFDGQGAPDPSEQELRQYLSDTLELTLDLLWATPNDDQGLHVFRLALLHEDRLAERLAVAAQWLGFAPDDPLLGPIAPPLRSTRPAVWMPAGHMELGSPPGGLVPPNERWVHAVQVPEVEIDAQVVNWGRFAEFVQDGGYDHPVWWTPEGWQWVQDTARRAPRGVEQWHGAVVLDRWGRLCRAAAGLPAVHVTWHEAHAWCRWAGRRLPTEVEWELAATTAATRGFVWGDVHEWMLGSARPYPGGQVRPVSGFAPYRADGGQRVLRGSSSWTVRRVAHVRSRRFVDGLRDDLFCGFRSCAL
jgi:iron(II)-dependent oxidoreductase